MIDCTECAEILPDILEGKGDPGLQRRLLEQADACERCKHCVESYRKCAELTGQAYGDVHQPELCAHLLTYLREHLQGPTTAR